MHTWAVIFLGGSSGVDPPVPIPNTVVKRPSADDTALVTEWENRSPPGFYRKTRNFGLYGFYKDQNLPPVPIAELTWRRSISPDKLLADSGWRANSVVWP